MSVGIRRRMGECKEMKKNESGSGRMGECKEIEKKEMNNVHPGTCDC